VIALLLASVRNTPAVTQLLLTFLFVWHLQEKIDDLEGSIAKWKKEHKEEDQQQPLEVTRKQLNGLVESMHVYSLRYRTLKRRQVQLEHSLEALCRQLHSLNFPVS